MSSFGHDPGEYFTPSDTENNDTELTRVSTMDTIRSIGALASDFFESVRFRVEAFISPEVPSK